MKGTPKRQGHGHGHGHGHGGGAPPGGMHAPGPHHPGPPGGPWCCDPIGFLGRTLCFWVSDIICQVFLMKILC